MSNNLDYKLTLEDYFSNGMSKAIGQTDRLDSKMGSLGSTIRNVIGLTALISLGKSMVDVGTSFQNAEAQLTTALGSAKQAHELFLDMQKEAVNSPFNFEQILKGTVALISSGESVMGAKGVFNDLATAMAANGKVGGDELDRMNTNLIQIRNNGHATQMDIKQFGDAGIPIYQLLNDYAAKYNKQLKKGKISYEDITGALKLAGQEGGRYFSAQERMMGSTSAKLANLKDAWNNMLFDIFVEFEPEIRKAVEMITKFFSFIKENATLIKFGLEVAAITIIFTKLTQAVYAFTIALEFNPVILATTLIVGLAAAMFLLSNDTAEATKQQYKLFNSLNEVGQKALGVFNVLKGVSKLMSAGFDAKARASAYNDVATGIAMWGQAGTIGSKKAVGVMDDTDFYKKGGAGADNSGSASSAAEMSRRPQNLNININHLVEHLEVRAATLSETPIQIKELVAQALLEAVNDANLMTK